MKDLFKILLILGFFAFFGIATSKGVYDPCEMQIRKITQSNTTVYGYYLSFVNDTLLISDNKDTLWDVRTDQLCKVLRDSCNLNGRKILVVETPTDSAQQDTRYGKKVYFRTCP